MERYTATQFYRADSPESRILGESGLVPSEFVLAEDAQRALDVEREKVKELECYRALWKRRDDELTGVLAQRAALQARATELERDNAAMKQLFDANPSALWAQLATLQAQLAAEQHRADRAVQDRRDALDVKTKEGMSCSEWLMRTATAERQVNELKAQVYDAPSDLVGRWVREADMQALRAENARLREALQLIVHGTQDEAPPWRCLGVTQMQVIARDALQPERGEP